MTKAFIAFFIFGSALFFIVGCKKDRGTDECSQASKKVADAFVRYGSDPTTENCNNLKTEWTTFSSSACFASTNAEDRAEMQSIIDGLGNCMP